MLFTQEKERSHRFKLALRMGLPIFALASVVSFAKITTYLDTIPPSFFIISIGVLGVMVYFIFYMIYRGMDERITDPITHTFTREYLFSLFKKELMKDKPYTIILITIDNLHDINDTFGVNNGDKVLYETAQWIGDFFEKKGIEKFPIGHFKGGDFLIGLRGEKAKYLSAMELMCIKFEDKVIDEIEVHISGAIVDTSYTKNINQLIEHLFELQKINREKKGEIQEENQNPSELERHVIESLKNRSFSMMYQIVKRGSDENVMLENSIKLKRDDKLIHQKSFMPVIERLGLRREFDMMILEQLVQDCLKQSQKYKFAITISPITARNRKFFEFVQALLYENQEAKGRIVFILSEKERYAHVSRYNMQLQAYRRMGIEIAFDFLGSYHSTFDYIKEIEIDYLRFDGYFGKEIDKEVTKALIKGFKVIAKELNFKLWIKMIETKEALEIAKNLHVDLLQGYALAKIEPIEEIE